NATRIWTVVGLLCVANIVAYVDRTNLSIAIAAEEFKNYFGLTNQQRGDLSSAFFWSYAFLQIPAGAFTDRYGVKYPLAVGFLMWSIISAATGWATALWQVFACRLLLGVGEAVITPGAMRWIRFNIDEKQRGLAVGLFFAGAKLGPAIGAYAAALLLLHYGWRNMFVILGLGCLVWLVPWMLIARNDDRELETAAQKKSGTVAVPFARVFSTPAIYGIIIGTFAYNYFNYFCLTWLPSYFRDQWKVTVAEMGLFTAFSFTGMAIVAIVAGAVADRMIARGGDPIRVRKGFTLAGLIVASTEIFGVMSGSRDIALAFAIISLAGLGLATANYWALTQSLMPGAAIGRIAGVQNFASNLSGIVAPILTGRLIAITGSYEAPMQAVLVLLAMGIAAYIFLVRPKYAPSVVPERTATV
ncbi:MAG TPA: MFS transporter, partial [Bryobacteraceae bacterium]|nr:MFS transporter [Bryobacteraceae bacterium]